MFFIINLALGSTTSIFVVLDNNTLHVNNLGDSRVLIMRDNKKIHKYVGDDDLEILYFF